MRREVQTGSPSGPALGALLLMTALVTYGLGSFEVGVALEGRHGMGFSPTRVSFMFVECSVVMAVVQAVIFFSRSWHPVLVRHGIAIGFLAMAAGLLLLPLSSDSVVVFAAVALTAGGSGALLPALSNLVSLRSHGRSGALFGLQSSASSLGQAIGSIAGGWLFGVLMTPSFWVTGVIMLGAAILAGWAVRAKQTVAIVVAR